MIMTFSGGANDVGASCTLIEMEGARILVDVGIRMGPEPDSQLPDLTALDRIGMPDAVLLTHAHTDHTGALPVLEGMLASGVPTYCTPATKALTQVLLEDAVTRQRREGEQQAEGPLYPPEAVAAALETHGGGAVAHTCPDLWRCLESDMDTRRPHSRRGYDLHQGEARKPLDNRGCVGCQPADPSQPRGANVV